MKRPARHRSRSRAVRLLLLGAGWLAVALGVIGIFLPVMPTVPFLLLAAACFARSSPRFHAWLLDHRLFGPLIRDYQGGEGIPLKAKAYAIGMTWLSVGVSCFLVPWPWVRVLMLVCAAGVTLWLLRQKTRA